MGKKREERERARETSTKKGRKREEERDSLFFKRRGQRCSAMLKQRFTNSLCTLHCAFISSFESIILNRQICVLLVINFLLISASLFQLNCTTSEPISPSDVIFMDLATFPLYSRHSFDILYFSPANA